MRKVNNSNSVLMQSLKDIKPTLNHEEWVRHSKKVRNNESSQIEKLRSKISVQHIQLPLLKNGGRKTTTHFNLKNSIEEEKEENTGDTRLNVSRQSCTRKEDSLFEPDISFDSRPYERRQEVTPPRWVASAERSVQRKNLKRDDSFLQNLFSDELLKKYNTEEFEKVCYDYKLMSTKQVLRKDRRISEKSDISDRINPSAFLNPGRNILMPSY